MSRLRSFRIAAYACAGLKRFTQRHRINRVYPDAVGSMPGQGIGWADGCAWR